MGWKKLIMAEVIHEKCNKDQSLDHKLPTDAFLVTYSVENNILYDITRAGSAVEIFDHYCDTYGKDAVKGIDWTQGNVNPKMYNYGLDKKPVRKKRKK